MLQSRLLGEKNQWSDAVRTYRRLQRELERRKTAVSTRRRSEAGGVKKQEEEEKDRPSEVVQRRRISGGPNEIKVQSVEEPSGPGKRKRVDEERTTQDYSDKVREEEKEKTLGGRNRTGVDLVVDCCEGNEEEEPFTPAVSDARYKP